MPAGEKAKKIIMTSEMMIRLNLTSGLKVLNWWKQSETSSPYVPASVPFMIEMS